MILVAGILVVVGSLLYLRLHAFLALLLGALVVGAITQPASMERYALGRGMSPAAAKQLAQKPLGDRVAEGFGQTCGQIAILIALASIVGTCLLESGAADRIVRSTLLLLGEARAPLAFLSSGFLLGIPVFFDTVFYLMIPLGKATFLRTGGHYLFYILTIVAGATMTHSLVPPTPGPLFAAAELHVDIGVMILGGCIVGVFCAAAGYFFSLWADRRWEVPLRGSTDLPLERLKELSQRGDDSLPPLGLSLLPIVLPVALIGTKAMMDAFYPPGSFAGVTGVRQAAVASISFLGDKNIAMALATLIAIVTLVRQKSSLPEGRSLESAVLGALTSAGTIILITGAGGAFGAMLQQSGIGTDVEELARGYQASVIPLAFAMTVLIRTAQGSATVAMITSAGAFAGVAAGGQLGFHPVYLALAIGCGSKPIWWMNDSGFWVVNQMSGMTEKETLKTCTPLSAMMGVVGLVVIMIGAWLFPLV